MTTTESRVREAFDKLSNLFIGTLNDITAIVIDAVPAEGQKTEAEVRGNLAGALGMPAETEWPELIAETDGRCRALGDVRARLADMTGRCRDLEMQREALQIGVAKDAARAASAELERDALLKEKASLQADIDSLMKSIRERDANEQRLRHELDVVRSADWGNRELLRVKSEAHHAVIVERERIRVERERIREDLAKEIAAHLEAKAKLKEAEDRDANNEAGAAVVRSALGAKDGEQAIAAAERVAAELAAAQKEIADIKARPFEFLHGLGYHSPPVAIRMLAVEAATRLRADRATTQDEPAHTGDAKHNDISRRIRESEFIHGLEDRQGDHDWIRESTDGDLLDKIFDRLKHADDLETEIGLILGMLRTDEESGSAKEIVESALRRARYQGRHEADVERAGLVAKLALVREALGATLGPDGADDVVEKARLEGKIRALGPFLDVVFDGPPGPQSGRFIEVEDMNGCSVNAGEWIDRKDGLWALRIPMARPSRPSAVIEMLDDVREALGARSDETVMEAAIRLRAQAQSDHPNFADRKISINAVLPATDAPRVGQRIAITNNYRAELNGGDIPDDPKDSDAPVAAFAPAPEKTAQAAIDRTRHDIVKLTPEEVEALRLPNPGPFHGDPGAWYRRGDGLVIGYADRMPAFDGPVDSVMRRALSVIADLQERLEVTGKALAADPPRRDPATLDEALVMLRAEAKRLRSGAGGFGGGSPHAANLADAIEYVIACFR